jgi:L-lysine exporter family protein LysE/ArgO
MAGMVTAFSSGFSLSFALIVAIGAQNAFVLRQGLLRQHVLPVVLFCAVSDAVLIAVRVGGATFLLTDLAASYRPWLFGFASIWPAAYGGLRNRDVIKVSADPTNKTKSGQSFGAIIGTAAVLTFGNPHVYLNTVLLIGTVSVPFTGADKLAFATGASGSLDLYRRIRDDHPRNRGDTHAKL